MHAEGLTRTYQRGAETVFALRDFTCDIPSGEFVAIVGPSGSGKTTLLNLLGCLDAPTSGKLSIAGVPVEGLSESARTRLRRKQVGFVFQQFRLVPALTVEENVALPALFAGRPRPDRVTRLLEAVGMEHRRSHRPHQLSGGEMQRAAIARALINEPEILLADEPTGNLDSASGAGILELFRDLNRGGLTIIVVTHNPDMASAASRQLVLVDGRLASH